MSKVNKLLELLEASNTASGHKAHLEIPEEHRMHVWLNAECKEDQEPDIQLSGTTSEIRDLHNRMKHAKQIAFYSSEGKLYCDGKDYSSFVVHSNPIFKTIKMIQGAPSEQSTKVKKYINRG